MMSVLCIVYVCLYKLNHNLLHIYSFLSEKITMGKKNKNKKVKTESGGSNDGVAVAPPQKKKKSKLEDQNLDDFLDNWDVDDDSGDEMEATLGEEKDEEEEQEEQIIKPPKTKKKKKEKSNADKAVNPKEKKENDSTTEGQQPDSTKKSGAKQQKKYISSLQETDPDFFDFLKENDEELLNFDESDSEDEEDEKPAGVHQLPGELEVASDESDFEDEGARSESGKTGKSNKKISQVQLDAWIDAVKKQPNISLIQDIIEAFRAAVASIGAGDKTEEDAAPLKFVVEGGTVFNSVVRLCVVHLQPALKTVLKLDTEVSANNKPEKSKKWKRVEKQVRIYLLELVTLLSRVNEQTVFSVLLKHVHSMLPYFTAYQKGAKLLMSRLINIWSTASETPRILAFMCLVKLTRSSSNLLEPCVKAMYLAYVKNCKFTSPSTLPSISFMKRSLVEMFGLDHNLAYYQAFVYIRQLAIHLRNAITTNKKDSVLAVYNWQFIHSLELWGALVGHCSSSETIRPLIYPLVQVIMGTAKLIPTPKYYPLRFHCATILRDISSTTGTFIPVLPLYLEVLNTFNFKKKSKKVSMKPLDFSCVLKLSKSQMLENGFKDATIEEVYGGMLSYMADNSNKISFPELVTPLIFQLKDFLKSCKVQNYSKKIKGLLEKTVANQKMIDTRRKHVNFGVGESQKIQVWEAQVGNDGTPLLACYNNWKKVSQLQHAKKVSEQQKLDDYSHIPQLKKKKMRMKEDTEPEVGGFLSGSDDDFDDEENFKLKEERGKKRKSDGLSDEDDDSEEEEDLQQQSDADSEDEKDEDKEDAEENEEGDAVEDLKLEDLESESEAEMDDEFEDGNDEEEGDSSDEDSDDESD